MAARTTFLALLLLAASAHAAPFGAPFRKYVLSFGMRHLDGKPLTVSLREASQRAAATAMSPATVAALTSPLAAKLVRDRASLVERSVSPEAPGEDAVAAALSAVQAAAGPDAAVVQFGGGVSTAKPRTAFSYTGLNERQQNLVNGGFNGVEPPDQALCVGNGFVIEAVNDAVRVFKASVSDAPLIHPVSLNAFYGYPRATTNVGGKVVYGPTFTDPSCVYVPQYRRFIHTALRLRHDPKTGAETGVNSIDIAVSLTPDPTGSWRFYSIPAQSDGTQMTARLGCTGTPRNYNAVNGPCLADQPHIGFDSHGLYISTNEFDYFGPNFDGAVVRAVPLKALITGAPKVTYLLWTTKGAPSESTFKRGFSVIPSLTRPVKLPGQYAAEQNVKYFMSVDIRIQLAEKHTSTVILWRITNTDALGRGEPYINSIQLQAAAIKLPSPMASAALADANQPSYGQWPLGQCSKTAACRSKLRLQAPAPGLKISVLDGGDSRMQSVFLDGRLLWGVWSVSVTTGTGRKLVGIQRVAVDLATFKLARRGTFAVPASHLLFPTIAFTRPGEGILGFSLTGDKNFPSAAYAPFDGFVVGPVAIPGRGAGLQDGFTGYSSDFFTNAQTPSRWGDYSATAVDESGAVWLATEFIARNCSLAEFISSKGSCGGTRTLNANWATRITKVVF